MLKRLLRWTLVVLAMLAVAAVARGLYVFRDRSAGYRIDLHTTAPAEPGPLRAGFGRVKINPDVSDPKRPVWVAGFSQNRAATALHDDLWAVACVLDDGHTRLGIVVLDAIGFFYDDVIAVRQKLDPAWKIDYTVVCATHNHSTPDLMGLWGKNILHTGVDPAYRKQVIDGATKALGDAATGLQPARAAFHKIPTPPDGLVTDTRKPIVFDPDIRVMHFTNPTNGSTIGTLVGWADHPETPWGRNTEITADFCGYLRDVLEKGFAQDGRTFAKGLGGVHMYINGAIGGLMTTSPNVTVHDPFLDKDYKEAGHDKARALGHQLASRILPLLEATNTNWIDRLPIGVQARTFEMPLDNLGYLVAAYLGLIDRGHSHWKKLKTEAAVITLGEASIACVPGEIYPEIINGGVEHPAGADFDIQPVEVPPLRDLMPGKVKFVFGLANDEIGYLIPKSEWDRKPPYIYGATHRVYGEINSCGPEAGRLVYSNLAELCREAKAPTRSAPLP